jgi:acetyltransferase
MRNLLRGGFDGPILPVNPKERAICGVLTYQDVPSLPLVPDVAVICTPPRTVPDLIDTLGARGTKAVVCLTAGLAQTPDGEPRPSQGRKTTSGERPERESAGQTLQDVVLQRARAHQMRILGPNCVGLILPNAGLNASFAHIDALPGQIAFVSQSGALCTSVLDWARSNGIGFSCFVSLGDLADIDFGDVLDYLGTDPETQAILLYIESIGVGRAREFMSAARAAARNKPVIAVKAGRMAEGAQAAASHTGALAGSDEVYDAALRRAGILRVYEIDELFYAVETLARARPIEGDRLAIVTNGGGPGVLATDAVIAGGGRLAQLSGATIAKLDQTLPPTWSRGNPVDIIGDAAGDRYVGALEAVLDDDGVDGVLVMHVPAAVASSQDAARHVIDVVQKADRPVLTSWLGRDAVAEARTILREAGVPTYETPYDAIRAFLHMVNFRRTQESLLQVPPSALVDFTPDTRKVCAIVEQSLATAGELLSEVDAKAVLSAYGINVVETRIAASPDQAAKEADALGYPVAVKILSPQITHKSDVGGVALNLEGADAVRATAEAMHARAAKLRPDAEIRGFTVQRMAEHEGVHELIVGVTTDIIFGPVILFGQGGTAVEVIADRAVALPPLNMSLARDLISRTRVSKMLDGYRDRPRANLDAICTTLMKVAQLVADVPQIAELDINPLFADEHGVVAVDARIRLEQTRQPGPERLAILPYPKELEEHVTLDDGQTVLLRPIRPEDVPAHERFVSKLTQEDLRQRFLGAIRKIPRSQMARMAQIDYAREMAFIATIDRLDGEPETLGVVRMVTDPNDVRTDLAIVVRSDLKRRGIGVVLMNKLLDYCRARGTRELVAPVLRENQAMLGLMKKVGFTVEDTPDETIVLVRKKLTE